MSAIESEMYEELYKTKIQMTSSLLSTLVPGNKKVMDVAYDMFDAYTQLALPYRFKKDNIAIDKAYWVNLLKEKNKKYKETRKEKENKK